MPLWLWAVVLAVLTVLAIVVVEALGGHAAVVKAILGDTGPARCSNGPASRGPSDEWECWGSWQDVYILAGVAAFGFVVLYRWTIGLRRDRRWPGR